MFTSIEKTKALPRIKKIDLKPKSVQIHWSDRSLQENFSWFWLRDHSQDPNSLNANTFQREIDVFALSDIRPHVVQISADRSYLDIEWLDNTKSRYSAEFLQKMALKKQENQFSEKQLWTGQDDLGTLPKFSYQDVMLSKSEFHKMLAVVHRLGFALIGECPVTTEDTQKLLERVNYIRNSIFGQLWTFSNNMEHSDSAYGVEGIAPHTDGTYCFDPPGLQVFHCLLHDGSGGESILVDGFAIAETIRSQDPHAFKILTNVNIPAHYRDQNFHLQSEHPVIELGKNQQLRQISFNNYDRSPFWLGEAEMEAFYHSYGYFQKLANDINRQLRFHLDPGFILMMDNWRLLHGRTQFTGKRVMCGCYHNYEDFESCLRIGRFS